jgi:hypothetical protein
MLRAWQSAKRAIKGNNQALTLTLFFLVRTALLESGQPLPQGFMFARIARVESTLALLSPGNASIALRGGLLLGRGKVFAMAALGGAFRRALDQSFALYAKRESGPLEIPRTVLSARKAPFLPPQGRRLVRNVPWGSGKIQVGLLLAKTALPGSM